MGLDQKRIANCDLFREDLTKTVLSSFWWTQSFLLGGFKSRYSLLSILIRADKQLSTSQIVVHWCTLSSCLYMRNLGVFRFFYIASYWFLLYLLFSHSQSQLRWSNLFSCRFFFALVTEKRGSKIVVVECPQFGTSPQLVEWPLCVYFFMGMLLKVRAPNDS